MFKSEIYFIVFSLFTFVFLPLSSNAEWKTLKSPSSNFCIEFSLSPEGRPTYKVTLKGKSIIEPSGLGFVETKGIDWTKGFDGIAISKTTAINREWQPIWGERSKVLDHYTATEITYENSIIP
jgi:hypothetical protein